MKDGPLIVKISVCFPGTFWYYGETRDDPTSDHSHGNAIDIYPGEGGEEATGQDRIEGRALARYLTRGSNPSNLKVRRVIWRGQIWRSELGSWQPHDYDNSEENWVTHGHFDHLHVGVEY